MKCISTILFFIAISSCSMSLIAKEPELTVKATFRGIYPLPDITFGKWNIDYCLFEIHLINSSNSSVEFLTYTCTPGINIVWDNKNLTIITNKCVSNNLTTITLGPKQIFSFTLILKPEKELNGEQIKFGWILLTYENTSSPSNFFNVVERCRKNFEYVIWSNPVNLESVPRMSYDIN